MDISSLRRLFRSQTARRSKKSRAGLAFEKLEDRYALTVSAADITSIISSADGDGNAADAHIRVLQGSMAPVTINFSYSATKISTATGTISNNPAADVAGTVTGLPAGMNKNGAITLNVSTLSVGDHNVRLVVDDADPGQRQDNDANAVEIYATITVSLNVNAADSVYTGAPYAGPVNVHVNPNAASSAGSITLTYFDVADLGTPLAGAPTNAGSYRVAAHFASSDLARYTNADGFDDFTIAKADADVTVNGYTGSYDGQYHGATGSVIGVDASGTAAGSNLDLGASFKDVPGGTAHWVFEGGTNYNDQEGDVDIEITKADAIVTVSGYTGVYDAQYHGATGSVVGFDASGTAAGSNLDLGASFKDVPGGTAHWVFEGGTNYNDQEGDVDIEITKADAIVTVSGYTGVYDAQYHGATGSVVGFDASGTAAGSNLDLGASFKNVPGGTANWYFDGGNNYNNQAGSVAIIITAKALGADSANTQSALNVAKDGNLALRIDVNESGIVDGQSVANLFTGALFSLTVGGQTYSVTSQATVVDGILHINFRLSEELKIILAANTTATSAKNAPTVNLELNATSNDGNYSLDATALTRLFNSSK